MSWFDTFAEPRRTRGIASRAVSALMAVAMAGSLVGRGTAAEPSSDAPKDVLLVTLDALRQDHLSLFGYTRTTSPSIDWLGQHGLALRDVVPAGLSTKTSLTSLLTSLEYRTHHILEKNEHLPERILTLAEAFRDQGYATAAFVATPHIAAEMGYGQGFDLYQDFAGEGLGYVDSERVRERLLAYLGEPLPAGRRARFVYVHFQEPHPPWTHPSPWLTEKEGAKRLFSCVELPPPEKLAKLTPQKRVNLIAKYDGAILAADRVIGAMLETLKQQDRLRRTVIGVSTDHGLELVERYSASHGWNPFDEVARGFLVLYDGSRPSLGPAPKLQGRNVDVGPTLMKLAGAEIPSEFQGVDLLGDPSRVPEIAISRGNHCVAVRTLTHKLIWIDFPRDLPFPASLKRGFTLFDLRKDPGELVDVQKQQPEVFERLEAAYQQFRRDEGRGAEAVNPEDAKHDAGLSDETRERLNALGYAN